MKLLRKNVISCLLLGLLFASGTRAFSQTINISPDTLYFGRIPEGTVAIRDILIFNIGVQALNVSSLRFEGTNAALLSLVDDPGAFSLNLAETKVVSIRLMPDSEGPISAKLMIESNASTSPDEISITGEGSDLDKGLIFFERIFGRPERDRANCVNVTQDRGYIIAGSTVRQEDVDEFGDASLIKLDEYGQIQWNLWYGERDWGEGFSSAIPTSDGGYIAVGSKSYSDRSEPPDVYVVKVNASGDLLWENTYGRSDFRSDSGSDIIATSDEGFLVCGVSESVDQTQNPPKQHDDVYLIKIDSQGNVVWERVYGDLGGENAASIKQTGDGGYIFAGSTSSFSTGGINDYDFYLVKIDADGNFLWQKTYGASDWDRASNVTIAPDNGYIIAGWTASPEFGAVARDVFLVKTDAAGNEQWHHNYGWDHNDAGSEVIATSDGGYMVVGGSARYYDAGLRDWRSDMYVVKTDASGGILWERTFGGLHEESASGVRQTNDGGYIISGFTHSYSKDDDVYLLKVDGQGNVTSVPDRGDLIPKSFMLAQNFPNPFNPVTTIEYHLPKGTHVSLDIFNIQGQKIQTLFDDYQSSGQYKINFEARGLPSGLYFYRLRTDAFTQVKRMLLLK